MLLIPLLILILFLGFEITIILSLKMGLLERMSLSFLLGIGLSTFIVFLLAFVFNLNFSPLNTLIILISSNIIAFVVKYREIIIFLKSLRFEKMTIKPKIAIFWGFILIIFAHTLLANSFWPVADWDAIALYDFRAKIFLFDTNLIHAASSNNYFMGYPLLTSLAHLFVYQTGLNNPRFIYSLFYLSLIVIFYYSLRRNVSENKAILFTVISSLVPEIFAHATVAYTNLAYTVYLCSGTFYLYNWLNNKKLSFLLLSAMLIGLSSWVRSAETFWMIPLFVMFSVALISRKWREFVYYLIIVMAISRPWNIFMNYISGMITPTSTALGLNYFDLLKSVSFERLILVANFLYKSVFSTWGLIFIAFILIVVKDILSWKRKHNVFLYITLLFFILLFVGTLIFSMTFPEWQTIPDSARRMSMFLLPLMIYSIAIGI